MSVGTMLLSGVLVASGLVLGTFTLHGYLDSDWAQMQLAASAANSKPAAVVQATTEQFPSRSRFVARDAAAELRPSAVKANGKPAATPTVRQAETKTATAKSAAKPAIKKKVADKQKQQQPPPAQQASLQFPWNWKLFGN